MVDWERTYRWPTTGSDGKITEDYEKSDKAFAQGGSVKVGGTTYDLESVQSLRSKVSRLFSYPLTIESSFEPNMWGSFASNGAEVQWPPGLVANIADPHDTVHLNIGGDGTMSLNDYGAFDPTFYLHHCNIDRLYAFWEYLYPAYWINDGWNRADGTTVPFKNSRGTFIQDEKVTVNGGTGLAPFRKQDGNYWTSDDARGLVDPSPTTQTKKYYTYPPIGEVQVDKFYDPKDETLRKKYRAILLNEWSPDLSRAVVAHQTIRLTGSLPTTLSHIIDFLLKDENELVNLRQFYLIGELPEFAFPEFGSYRLELYIKSSSPAAEGIVINSISVLGRTDPSTCASCRVRQAAGSHIRGYMSLDPLVLLHLISQLNPSSLPWDAKKTPSEDDLSRTLSVLIHERLGMRLVKPDGTKIAGADAADDFLGKVKLDEAKAPKVSLSSHIITFNPKKPSDHISFEEPKSHHSYGIFQPNAEWKSFEV